MPFLSALEVVYDDALYQSTFTYLLTVCVCSCVTVRLVSLFHDEASRFLRLTAKPGRQYIEFDDFLPLIQV